MSDGDGKELPQQVANESANEGDADNSTASDLGAGIEGDEEHVSTNECYTCGGKGHWARECTTMRKQDADAQPPECHTCKGKGHLARICPTTIRSLSVALNRLAFGPSSRGKGVSLRSMERAVQTLEQQHRVQMQMQQSYSPMMQSYGHGHGHAPRPHHAMNRGRGHHNMMPPMQPMQRGGHMMRGGRGRGGYAPGGMPFMNGGEPQQLVVCHNCQQLGHVARMCPNRPVMPNMPLLDDSL